MMPVLSKKFIKMNRLVDPYERFDHEKNESYLIDSAPQEIKDLYPEYLKLRKKELWDFND